MGETVRIRRGNVQVNTSIPTVTSSSTQITADHRTTVAANAEGAFFRHGRTVSVDVLSVDVPLRGTSKTWQATSIQ